MSKKSYLLTILVLCLRCAILGTITTSAVHADQASREGVRASGPLVKREHRRTLFSSEDGEISAVRVTDNINGSYLLHFFTLEPNSLFLPAVLHADMVFYVHTGIGKLSWTEEDDVKSTEITRGDVYRLEQGAIFFIQSNLDTVRQKLRIHAIFPNSKNDLHEPATGPYSSIRDMVLGFDKQVLQAAFKVPKEVIDELSNEKNPPAIVHGLPRTKKAAFEMEAQFVRSLLGRTGGNNILFELNKKKKKKSSAKLFNLFKEDKDFKNCNGWSTTVTRKKLSALKGSGVGLFMVNLTAGSMMGPHWNPKATEIAVVLQGWGMIRIVCSSISNEKQCRNMRFKVEQGDVFAVPRFHPMAQISFNNDTLVFMGFSTWAKKNHPQFLAGRASVFRSLDKDVMAMSFNITNTTLDQLLAPQHHSVILGCVSCAEEELRILEEERARKREEAREREEKETRRREEEARKREEEAARREEEEKRRREEEEEEQEAAAKREEEREIERREQDERERREEEDEKKREEEEAARREEEARQREQEERERREEEVSRREGEERQKEKEEEAARQRKEEEARQMAKKEKEQADERRREKEAARREEEERIRREQEERKREQEHEQEEAVRRRQEQEKERRKEEQERGRSEEEWAEEEERRREEEAQREEEEEEEEGARERGEGGETGENLGGKGWERILPKKRLTV